MVIRLIKFTQHIENALCIYRNFCMYGRISQVLILIRIIVEVLLTIIHTVLRSIYYQNHHQCKNDVIYFYLTTFNSIIVIILSCYLTKKYKGFIAYLNSDCRFFSTDQKYTSRLRAKHSVCIALVFMLSIAKVLLFTYTQLSTVSLQELQWFWVIVFQMNLLMCDFRYIFEYLKLYCVLYVMSEQLKSVTRCIGNKNVSAINDNGQLLAEVDKWFIIYKHIRESAKLFNSIFGVQMTIMLATSMFYYIIFLYTMASQSVLGKLTLWEICTYLGTLILLLTILYMLSKAAQSMENNAELLRRRLCKLLILSLTHTESYKATRDLLRMMSTRPICARAFGSINVDMTLLPTCISIFTTYTVFALQLNNIV